MKKYRWSIVIVAFAVSVFVAFSLGAILVKPAPNEVVDSDYVFHADGCTCSIRLEPNALDGLIMWRGEVDEQPTQGFIEFDTKGGHAASGW